MATQLAFNWEEYMSFETNKREARLACAFRGHVMSPLRLTRKDAGRRRAAAKCRNCPAWLNVLEHPDSNECEAGGPALAMTCPTDEKWC
jgi:hypothetical protein